MPTYNADVLPSSTGKNLGSNSQEWILHASNIYLNGNALAAQANTFSVVTFSATPTFSVGGNNAAFKITLTANVVSSSLSGAVAGNVITFLIVQDGTGGWTFTWPTNVLGAIPVGGAASQVTLQSFFYDGTNAYPVAPGSIYP